MHGFGGFSHAVVAAYISLDQAGGIPKILLLPSANLILASSKHLSEPNICQSDCVREVRRAFPFQLSQPALIGSQVKNWYVPHPTGNLPE